MYPADLVSNSFKEKDFCICQELNRLLGKTLDTMLRQRSSNRKNKDFTITTEGDAYLTLVDFLIFSSIFVHI